MTLVLLPPAARFAYISLCMVDIIFHYPFLGAMGDHSKSKSFCVCGCVCVFNMQHFQCRRMFSGFYKWLLSDKILGRIKKKTNAFRL